MMGYRIEYKIPYKKKTSYAWLTLLFFLLFLLCVHYFLPEGVLALRSLLMPEALEALAQSIMSGQGLEEAIAAFGQELANGR